MKEYYTYTATNYKNTVLYTGVTNNLHRRMFEQKNSFVSSFAKRYHINKPIFYEIFSNPDDAIRAEKRIKGWMRQKNQFNKKQESRI